MTTCARSPRSPRTTSCTRSRRSRRIPSRSPAGRSGGVAAGGRPPVPGRHPPGDRPPDGVAGFAYVTAWRERPAYAATGEDTVYLAPGNEGRGLGRALLTALLAEAERAGCARSWPS
ncbi:GNAT family N-acetyltransferase [Oerskovia sp. M15]